jgi:hypothetical protein
MSGTRTDCAFSNIVINRNFYAQSNKINNIGQCYILGVKSFRALTLMRNVSHLYQTLFLTSISCYASVSCKLLLLCRAGSYVIACEKVSQSTKEIEVPFNNKKKI